MRIAQPNTIAGAPFSVGVFTPPGMGPIIPVIPPVPVETTEWTEVCLETATWTVINVPNSTIDRC
ncbi:MAG: hypothetical protein ACJARV_000057 [Candidatus Pseudothioglobus sp.]|jgi:hypothetical protein|tara:strand:- start:11380 stop:11574 length:195 start_codon:yes stop_codon:yes gene_type:complete